MGTSRTFRGSIQDACMVCRWRLRAKRGVFNGLLGKKKIICMSIESSVTIVEYLGQSIGCNHNRVPSYESLRI